MLFTSLPVCLEQTLGFVLSTRTFGASSKACLYQFENKKKNIDTCIGNNTNQKSNKIKSNHNII